MLKIGGYVLAFAGLLLLALNVKPVKEAINLPSSLPTALFPIIGIVLILVGVLIIFKFGSGGKQPKEVPIYHGKNIVGYRRMK